MSQVLHRKPTYSGRVFKPDALDPCSMAVSDTAKTLNVSRKHLSAFVNERVTCRRDLAKRLVTGTSVGSWLNLQMVLKFGRPIR